DPDTARGRPRLHPGAARVHDGAGAGPGRGRPGRHPRGGARASRHRRVRGGRRGGGPGAARRLGGGPDPRPPARRQRRYRGAGTDLLLRTGPARPGGGGGRRGRPAQVGPRRGGRGRRAARPLGRATPLGRGGLRGRPPRQTGTPEGPRDPAVVGEPHRQGAGGAPGPGRRPQRQGDLHPPPRRPRHGPYPRDEHPRQARSRLAAAGARLGRAPRPREDRADAQL
ncbi:MAG: Nitrate/nitrite response regulator protein, partial [uncultured Rubrobacteraceae bacterium]